MKKAYVKIIVKNIEFTAEIKHNISFIVGKSSTDKTHFVRRVLEIQENNWRGVIEASYPVTILDNREWGIY